MEKNFYKIIQENIEENGSRMLKDNFHLFQELLDDQQEVYAFCSELESNSVKLYVINLEKVYIASFTNVKSEIEIFDKNRIDKIDLIIDNKVSFSFDINNSKYTIDYSKMDTWYAQVQLNKWLLQFTKGLSL